MKKSGILTPEFAVGVFGVNAVVDMFAFSAKLQLAGLPPDLKFWMFWIGTAVLSLGIVFATYVFFGHKKIEPVYVASVAAVGLVLMIFASPYLPYFFPVDPVALSMGNGLEAGGGSLDWGWLVAPVLVAALLYGLLWMERRKK